LGFQQELVVEFVHSVNSLLVVWKTHCAHVIAGAYYAETMSQGHSARYLGDNGGYLVACKGKIWVELVNGICPG